MSFLSKSKFIFALVCNIVYVGQLFMTKNHIIPRRWRHTNIFWHRWSSLLNRLPHRLTTSWPSLATAPAYNTVAVSRDRAGLQLRGRLSRPRRLTTRRTTHPSAPVYNATADSSIRAASDVAVVSDVRLSRPGLHRHTGPHRLHEMFIGYEQVTAWVARFSFKLEANYHVLSAAVCTE